MNQIMYQEWKEYQAFLDHYFSNKDGFYEVISNPRFKELESKFLGFDNKAWLIEYTDSLQSQLTRAQELLDVARKAIEFYADKESYDRNEFADGFCAIFNELKDDHSAIDSLSSYGGKRAREALAKITETK